MTEARFKSPLPNGWHVVFDNGWTVSVQYREFTYCDLTKDGAANAEIAAWDKNRTWFRFEDSGDTVKGYVTPNELLEFMTMIAGKDKE